MDMGGGDPSVAHLPLSNPACNNTDCVAFAAAANQSQLVTPWAGQFEYGHWATWYYLIIIFVTIIWRGFYILNDRKIRSEESKASRPTFRQKTLAAGRYLAYRRLKGRWFDVLELPSFGVLALLLTTVLFLSLLTFVARPFYRGHEDYGSPPIAIRTGLMAFACTPILIALAGKANIVTLLTGISHEKLNVIHRWVGWITLALSLVHTIPFIVGPMKDPYDNLHFEFYGYGPIGATMYSGVPPLAMLFGLVALSVPYIRHRIYEGFYYIHILLAIIYLALLFWHAANILDSWAYLWATLALWLASYLSRAFWYTRPLNLRSEWFVGGATTLKALPGGMTSIEVLAPVNFSHKPAQHCFLRFPAISLLDNHPFTIISAPQTEGSLTKEGSKYIHTKSPTLVFLARTHAGFTRRLATYCASEPDLLVSAWIDGPYGGIDRPIEQLYDALILVAGGSGITACVPWLQHIVDRSRTTGTRSARLKNVVLNWVIREEEHFSWVKDELRNVLIAAAQSDIVVEMRFYVTGSPLDHSIATAGDKGLTAIEKSADALVVPSSRSSSSERIDFKPQFTYKRPMMDELLRNLESHGRIFVIGCGPESMRTDLSNACADAQLAVLKGDAQEVGMHLETFDW